jgi:hypothetical protein
METLEASLNGTLRTILVLVVLWWLLRMFMRRRTAHTTTSQGPTRPKGDVRIEEAQGPSRGARPSDGHIIDAEYEEIK